MKDGYCGQEVSFSTLWLSFTQTRIWTELNIALYCPHWSSPHAEKNAFHIGLQCPRTDQVLSKPCKAHLTCQNSKALTLIVPPSCTSAMYVSSWEDTESIRPTSNDDDRHRHCTMEEARNLNFCRTDRGGASELQTQNSVKAEAGLKFFSVNLAWNELHEK